MTRFKILEFKKSQYNYEAIENALSEKVSEGWKVISMHTDVSTDSKGIIIVLLRQIVPGDEETMSYKELYEKKEAELHLKKIQKEIDDIDLLPPGYTSRDSTDLAAAVAFGQVEAMKSMKNTNSAVDAFKGWGTPSSGLFAALGQKEMDIASETTALMRGSKFCTNCGAPTGTGKFCANCGNPL